MKFKKSGQPEQIAGAITIGAGLTLSQSDGLPVISLEDPSGPSIGEMDHGTVNSSITPDLAVASTHIITLGGNVTINNPVNAQAGHSYAFVLVQDGIGNRSLTWGSAFKWAAGTPFNPSTSPNTVDIITCIAITVGSETNLYAVGQKDFS